MSKETYVPKTKSFRWGTGLLVTAAFIGPGTLVTASRAGAVTQFSLLWAVVFSVVATCVLQVMAARLGLVTNQGINAAIKKLFVGSWLTPAMLGLVLLAILYGNSAYQTGNILGAVEGVEILTGELQVHVKPLLVLAIGLIALGFIWVGGLGLLQNVLGLLVALMSLLFLAAVFGAQPELEAVAAGLVPCAPEAGVEEWLLLVVGLIGTTVVPYNLFLHASAAAEQTNTKEDMHDSIPTESDDESTENQVTYDETSPEKDPESGVTNAQTETQTGRTGLDSKGYESERVSRYLRRASWDTIIAVGIGGVITASILVVAAVVCADAAIDATKLKVSTLAQLLIPVVGGWGEVVFGVGLLAAGLTSAITAPVAAGYCAAGCFGWKATLEDKRVKLVASLIVAIGINVGILFGQSPGQVILLAQVANGLLLPLVACFLLYALNSAELMGHFRNGWGLNALGGFVTLVATLLAARTFYQIFF